MVSCDRCTFAILTGIDDRSDTIQLKRWGIFLRLRLRCVDEY